MVATVKAQSINANSRRYAWPCEAQRLWGSNLLRARRVKSAEFCTRLWDPYGARRTRCSMSLIAAVGLTAPVFFGDLLRCPLQRLSLHSFDSQPSVA